MLSPLPLHKISPFHREGADTDARSTRRFDVICAGETLWKLAATPGSRFNDRTRLTPDGGAITVARALAMHGLHVGLATVLADDVPGRTTLDEIEASGIDAGGITIARPRRDLVVVDSRGSVDDARMDGWTPGRPVADSVWPLEVPSEWSSEILVLSGLSPFVPQAAALCKTARKARRDGSLVVLDFSASLHAWLGRDPRTVRMILREVDVARCSFGDLAVLGMDLGAVRSALRDTAVLVVSDTAGGAVATGPFGEVTFAAPERGGLIGRDIRADVFTATLCAQIVQREEKGESPSGMWHRVLRSAHAASSA